MRSPRDEYSPEKYAAASVYNAWNHAAVGAGVRGEFLHFDDLDEEQQARWRKIAIHGEQVLSDNDGKGYKAAAADLCALVWLGMKLDHLSVPEQLCWEAAARHLHLLFESESAEGMAEEEENWKEWARHRADTHLQMSVPAN